ncbi:hypothetical protein VCR5J5_240113 [Vibrio crassostreae]|uniref:Uncharacterized protein n=1 Tax=Vibrio crassostreae TaxID=246167 RepID=A0A822N1L2_9VIBR|nr:hypothetical protein VCR5J5_240113 [Vibrio crassostreae]
MMHLVRGLNHAITDETSLSGNVFRKATTWTHNSGCCVGNLVYFSDAIGGRRH